MRHLLVALLMAAASPLALSAQVPEAPKSSIGLPLPPIGLPLPPIGLQPADDRPTPEPAQPRRPHDGGRFWPRHSIVFFGPYYAWPGVAPWMQSPVPDGVAADSPQPATPKTGELHFDVHPAQGVQVFLDGDFVGTLDDFGHRLALAPGTWRVELRAAGFDTDAFDVRIAAGRTVTYRVELARAARSQEPAAPAPNSSDTFYLIPGCYLGNVPPEQVKLPPGCDIGRVIVHKVGR